MAAIQNSAGRLHFAFTRLGTKNRVSFDEFAQALGVSAKNALPAYSLMLEEFEQLQRDVEQLRQYKLKYELYQKNLPDIDNTLKSFTFQMESKIVSYRVSEPGLVALGFMAADFPIDGESDDQTESGKEIELLRKLVLELQREISQGELPEYLKAWLLELVRAIRDAIDRYQIRGAKGIERELAVILGELMQNQELANETMQKKPSAFAMIMRALDAMNKVVAYAEKLKPAMSAARKAIPFIKSVLGIDSQLPGLPAPTDTTPLP